MRFETSEVLQRERKVVEQYLKLVDRVLFGGVVEGEVGGAAKERGWDKDRAEARRRRRGGRSSLAPVLGLGAEEGGSRERADETVGAVDQEDEAWMDDSKDTPSELDSAFALFDASDRI